MPNKFSSSAWERNLELYEKTLKMPFNEELKDGTLDKAKFRHYIIQDAKYLNEYARVFLLAAAKARSSSQMSYLIEIAKDIVEHENSMHSQYLIEYNVSNDELEHTETSPACYHYTSFLLSIGYQESLPVILAALLPCFWIYVEVGKYVKASLATDNPFKLWIRQYGSEEFDVKTQEMIRLVDELAANESQKTLDKMFEVYSYAAKLEYLFWESAYKLEQWI